MYNEFGAHLAELDGQRGTRFAVWAPNATEVSVLSDQSEWNAGVHTLHPSDSGVWRCFVPGIKAGSVYKFGIRTRDGKVLEKADPFAFQTECPPKSASIVCDLAGFDWQDSAWMSQRANTNWLEQPVSIYEVHLASWKRPTDRRHFGYCELAHMLADYVLQLGYTHIQLMPICEYPFDGSWGYQTTGYYAPTARFGTPHDFMYMVDYLHQAGIGVFIDWVPAHFPTDGHGLANFDGTCCYEHADPREGFHPDWRSSIFNYGRHEVRDFLINSARFWLETYHVDGLRVDAVASMLYRDYSRKDGEWIPNQYGGRENLEAVQFLKDMNITVHGEFPGVLTIAEESTAWPNVTEPVYNGGLGFNLKWDMGWMNDTLHYLRREPIHRAHHQDELSFRMVYAFSEKYVLPLSHDEVVHGKQSLLSQMPGDDWQKFANLRMLYGYQFTTPGKPLLFMGGEFGQRTEWDHSSELDWNLLDSELHDGMRRFIGDLNRLYRTEPALHEHDCSPEGFDWIQCDDWQHSVFVFARYAKNRSNHIVVVMNFTPVPRTGYRIGVEGTEYIEVLNSDAKIYGGGNVGNAGQVRSDKTPMHGRTKSLSLQLPPLGIVILKSTLVESSVSESTPSKESTQSDAAQI
ncbi:MAG: 1,4-alpha-glucan branching protein GlgB [Planctomycetales bacterium]|nr:1,4-alpha-glucan branching protein GlgB [Planctomycetales bacterium]